MNVVQGRAHPPRELCRARRELDLTGLIAQNAVSDQRTFGDKAK